MNNEKKLIPSTKKMTPLVTAIISTIFWVVLFPLLLFGAIICLTLSSAPIIPWIGIIVYISVLLLSLTSPIAPCSPYSGNFRTTRASRYVVTYFTTTKITEITEKIQGHH